MMDGMHRHRGRRLRSALRLWRLGVAVMLTSFLGCRLPKGAVQQDEGGALTVGRPVSLILALSLPLYVANRTHSRNCS